MKNIFYWTFLFCFLTFQLASAQVEKKRTMHNPELSDQIDQMWDSQKKQSGNDKIYQLVKTVINKHGFPTYNLVGKTSAHFFVNMVLRCKHDPSFQYEILRLMDEALANHQASVKDYTRLAEFVETNQVKEPINIPQPKVQQSQTNINIAKERPVSSGVEKTYDATARPAIIRN